MYKTAVVYVALALLVSGCVEDQLGGHSASSTIDRDTSSGEFVLTDELSWMVAPEVMLVSEEEAAELGVESAASVKATLASCPSHRMGPRAKVTCRGVYARHEHEIVFLNAAGSRWDSAPQLKLFYRIGGGSYKTRLESPSDGQVTNNEQEVNLGCRRSCVYGIAWKHGCRYTSVTDCD